MHIRSMFYSDSIAHDPILPSFIVSKDDLFLH